MEGRFRIQFFGRSDSDPDFWKVRSGSDLKQDRSGTLERGLLSAYSYKILGRPLHVFIRPIGTAGPQTGPQTDTKNLSFALKKKFRPALVKNLPSAL